MLRQLLVIITLLHSLLTITWSSFSVGAMKGTSTRLYGGAHATKPYGDFFLLQGSSAIHAHATKFYGSFFYFRIWGLLHIFCYKTVRGHTTRLQGGAAASKFGASAHFFWLPDCTRQKPWWWQLFPSRKPILFYNIIHLLRSGIHWDLDNSCSILHKSRDGLWSFFLEYQTVLEHINKQQSTASNLGDSAHFLSTRLHESTSLMMAAFFPFENR